MLIQTHTLRRLTWLCAGFLTLLWGCSVNPPVQEMSNARQTLMAAKDAQAETLSPSQMQEAQQLMDKATGALESGDYKRAREFAVSAQKIAIKARHQAITLQQRQLGDF